MRYAQQETELIRIKRSIVHDKQMELPIREITDNTLYHRVHVSPISTRDFEEKVEFNDPYYDDMWYLVNVLSFFCLFTMYYFDIYLYFMKILFWFNTFFKKA